MIILFKSLQALLGRALLHVNKAEDTTAKSLYVVLETLSTKLTKLLELQSIPDDELLAYARFFATQLSVWIHLYQLDIGNDVFSSVVTDIQAIVEQLQQAIPQHTQAVYLGGTVDDVATTLQRSNDLQAEQRYRCQQMVLDKQSAFNQMLYAVWLKSIAEHRFPRRVFISYAWPAPDDTSQHWTKEFIETLCKHLHRAGVQVYLDEYDSSAGYPLNQHMDKIFLVDHVLVISSPVMAAKLKLTTSGVYCEHQKIMQRVDQEPQLLQQRFVIPVLLNYQKHCHSKWQRLAELNLCAQGYSDSLRRLLQLLHGFSITRFKQWWQQQLQQIGFNQATVSLPQEYLLKQQLTSIIGGQRLFAAKTTVFIADQNNWLSVGLAAATEPDRQQLAAFYARHYAVSFILFPGQIDVNKVYVSQQISNLIEINCQHTHRQQHSDSKFDGEPDNQQDEHIKLQKLFDDNCIDDIGNTFTKYHILLIGEAGIGKTTFTRALICMIHNNKLFSDRFKVVIRIALRDLANCEIPKAGDIDLVAVLQAAYQNIFDELGWDQALSMTFCQGLVAIGSTAQTLWILDGWDEFAELLREQPHLKRLVPVLRATIKYSISTSRPYGIPSQAEFAFDRRLEITGLEDKQINHYLINLFEHLQQHQHSLTVSTEQRYQLRKLLAESEVVREIKRIPILLEVVVYLWLKQVSLFDPATLSKELLYDALFDVLMNRFLEHPAVQSYYRRIGDYQQLDQLLPIQKQQLLAPVSKTLATIAFGATQAGRSYFAATWLNTQLSSGVSSQLVPGFNLLKHITRSGLLRYSSDSTAQAENTRSSYFAHLSLQEYMAAMHIKFAMTSPQVPPEVDEFIRLNRFNRNFLNVFKFALWQCCLTSPDIGQRLIVYFCKKPSKVPAKVAMVTLLRVMSAAGDALKTLPSFQSIKTRITTDLVKLVKSYSVTKATFSDTDSDTDSDNDDKVAISKSSINYFLQALGVNSVWLDEPLLKLATTSNNYQQALAILALLLELPCPSTNRVINILPLIKHADESRQVITKIISYLADLRLSALPKDIIAWVGKLTTWMDANYLVSPSLIRVVLMSANMPYQLYVKILSAYGARIMKNFPGTRNRRRWYRPFEVIQYFGSEQFHLFITYDAPRLVHSVYDVDISQYSDNYSPDVIKLMAYQFLRLEADANLNYLPMESQLLATITQSRHLPQVKASIVRSLLQLIRLNDFTSVPLYIKVLKQLGIQQQVIDNRLLLMLKHGADDASQQMKQHFQTQQKLFIATNARFLKLHGAFGAVGFIPVPDELLLSTNETTANQAVNQPRLSLVICICRVTDLSAPIVEYLLDTPNYSSLLDGAIPSASQRNFSSNTILSIDDNSTTMLINRLTQAATTAHQTNVLLKILIYNTKLQALINWFTSQPDANAMILNVVHITLSFLSCSEHAYETDDQLPYVEFLVKLSQPLNRTMQLTIFNLVEQWVVEHWRLPKQLGVYFSWACWNHLSVDRSLHHIHQQLKSSGESTTSIDTLETLLDNQRPTQLWLNHQQIITALLKLGADKDLSSAVTERILRSIISVTAPLDQLLSETHVTLLRVLMYTAAKCSQTCSQLISFATNTAYPTRFRLYCFVALSYSNFNIQRIWEFISTTNYRLVGYWSDIQLPLPNQITVGETSLLICLLKQRCSWLQTLAAKLAQPPSWFVAARQQSFWHRAITPHNQATVTATSTAVPIVQQ